MSAPSLKRQILALSLAAVALVWVATAAFTWWDSRHEVGELLDAHLAQAASLLIVQVSEDLDEVDLEHAPVLHGHARRVAFQVWEHGERLRLHSANAPNSRMGSRQEGFSDVVVDGVAWRVFTAWDGEGKNLIHVGERAKVREELATGLVKNLLLPLGLALPLLGLALWLAVGRGLKPVERLADEVARRDPDNLADLRAEGAPREVAPLVARLNALFRRMGESLASERRFTADAAHELRTPLSAVRAQAQVARAAMDPAEREHALDGVVAGCDRATRLVEQLLTLARLEAQEETIHGECSLREVAATVLADLAPAAVARNIALELADGDDAAVRGQADLLGVLLRNLVDNAIRYSPAGTTVSVAVESGAGGPALRVSDQGPGVAPAERPQVLQRFYRGLGTGAPGSGLGLSIAQRVADLHRASLVLEDAPGGRGLAVRVSFPAPGSGPTFGGV